MNRKQESRRRYALWIERAGWNAAAAAALGVMIWVLLYSLQWLDRIAPYDPVGPMRAPTEAGAQPAVQVDARAPEVASANPPSG